MKADHTVDRQFGYKQGNLPGLDSLRGLLKTVFDFGGQACRIISAIHEPEVVPILERPSLAATDLILEPEGYP